MITLMRKYHKEGNNMSTLALSRTYTDEKNNQMLNAIIDFITSMKNQMLEYHEIKKLEKDLDEKFTNIDNTLDLFIAHIQEISKQKITEQYISDIFRNDTKFYGFIQNLYLFSYDAYEIIIKLKDRSNKYTHKDINNYKAILNFAIIFLSGFIDVLNDIKFRDIINDNAE